MDAKSLLQKISPTRLDQMLLALISVGLVVAVCFQLLPKSSEASDPNQEPESVPDTYIPEGFVLIPIRLENQTALLAMMGSYAVLNIYQVDLQSGSRGKIVAKSIKVLRAPYDPESLSVLCPEDKAGLFMGQNTGFYGVLQNRKAEDLTVSSSKKSENKILIESFEN